MNQVRDNGFAAENVQARRRDERYNMTQVSQTESSQSLGRYSSLAVAAGIGSMLGSGIIVGLSAAITVWQEGLQLSNAQVGQLSGIMTFAIAFGSLMGGRIADKIGRVFFFNWINLLYAVGAVVCIFAQNFWTLLAGLIIAGWASGADLPVSMTVVSHDAPNVFAILAIFAVIAFVWRVTSPTFKKFHDEADARDAQMGVTAHDTNVSVTKILFGRNKVMLLSFLAAILIFYVGWNLLANTWGQFQTFMFAKAGASQSLATGLGIILNFITLILNIAFASVAGGKYRNKAFVAGIVIQLSAMIIMALAGTNLWIVGATAFMNLGSPLAGEAIYKVWTQESFPIEIRASIQGYINGFSRLCCGLFALITPMLVVPGVIQKTMWGFAGVVFVMSLAGLWMLGLQKKYGTDEERQLQEIHGAK